MARTLDFAREIARIEAEFGVRFLLGEETGSQSAHMDKFLIAQLSDLAKAQGLDARQMPCGAGHDAAVFAQNGVPTAMIFIRNDRGSHNPDEAMDLGDFAQGLRLMVAAVEEIDAA